MSITEQGQDGTPHLAYYDKVHDLGFVWDNTQGDWIDVSYGGMGEPMFARIPWSGKTDLVAFKDACVDFINHIHYCEDVTVGGHR